MAEEEDFVGVGDLFAVSYEKLDFEFGEIKQSVDALTAATTDLDLTGQVVWPGCHFLTWYLIHFQGQLKGRTVLALGCGSGLCGLVATRFVSKMVLTDGIDDVVTLLEGNVRKYSPPEAVTDVLKLEWEEADSRRAVKAVYPEPFEVIIGADTLYTFFPGCIGKLLETVAAFIHPERGVFLSALIVRRPIIEDFVHEAATAAGLVWEVLDTCYLPDPAPEAITATLEVYPVQMLAFAVNEAAIAAWRPAPRPPHVVE